MQVQSSITMTKFLRSQPKLRESVEMATLFCHLCLKDLSFPLEAAPTFWEELEILACSRCLAMLRTSLSIECGLPGEEVDAHSPVLQLLAQAVLLDRRALNTAQSVVNTTEDYGSYFDDMLAADQQKSHQAEEEGGGGDRAKNEPLLPVRAKKKKKQKEPKQPLAGKGIEWTTRKGARNKRGGIFIPLSGMEDVLTHMTGKQVSLLVDSMQAAKLFPKDIGQTSSRIWEQEEEGHGPRNVFKLKQEDQCIGYNILVKLVKTLITFMPEARDMAEAMDLIRMFFRFNQGPRDEVVRMRGGRKLLVPCISVQASAEVICDFHNLQVHDPRVMAYCSLPGIGAEVGKLAVLVDSNNGNDDVIMFLVWSEVSGYGIVIPCLAMQPHSLCSHCDTAFGTIPCPSCRCTTFCSQKCRIRSQHAKQCGMLTRVLKEANIQVLEV